MVVDVRYNDGVTVFIFVSQGVRLFLALRTCSRGCVSVNTDQIVSMKYSNLVS